MSLQPPPLESPNENNWSLWQGWYRNIQRIFGNTGLLRVANGGTGLGAYTIGDLLYASAAAVLSKLAIGASGRWLGSSGTAPQWNAPGALTKADDTNVTLTLGGSAATALLNAASITAGWTGTLAAARLNANVVHAITNDTNINGAIATQTLTLSWAGTLSVARGGTGQGTYTPALVDAALTSGRIPTATTGGRLTDGPAPVADGTYNVDGAAAGTVSSFTTTKGLITAVTVR